MISKLASLLKVSGENFKLFSKSPIKWLAFIVATAYAPKIVEIEIPTMSKVHAVEQRTMQEVDNKHRQVIDMINANHKEAMDKLKSMNENIKTLDKRVYELNRR